MTGHAEPGETDLVPPGQRHPEESETVIMVMGLKWLPETVGRLIRNGKDAKTPAAVISNGTRPEQCTVVAPLDEIAEKARQAGACSPALVIVGEVVRLRDRLNWFK